MVTIESHHHLDCYVSTYDVVVLRESADLLYKLRKARMLVKMGSLLLFIIQAENVIEFWHICNVKGIYNLS